MTYETRKKIRRSLSIFFLLLSGFIVLFVGKQAYALKEWNTIAASLAVFTALITIYISFKITWKSEDDAEPELIVKWDFESSPIVNLVLENIGGGSAYEISIEWEKELKNAIDKPITFGKIPCLSKNQKIKTVVNSQPNLWKNAKEFGENNDEFCGVIKFKRKRKAKRFDSCDFCISLGHKKLRIDFETSKQEFYSQGKKIVSQLEKINENLRKQDNQLTNKE